MTTEAPPRRPGLRRLAWYCYGGSLPGEHHSWVLHDVTCRTWWLRHFARWLMVIVPLFVAYLALAPIPFGLRFYTGLAFSGGIFMFALVNVTIDTERRAVRAGYGADLPPRIRGARAIERQRNANSRRRERVAERQIRRLR